MTSNTISEKPRKILITGGAGHIGSILSRLLLKDGHHITILDRLLFGSTSVDTMQYFYPNSFRLIHGDIRDEKILRKCLEGQDIVIHLAAIVGDPACSVKADEAVETNVNSTKLLAKISDELGIGKLVFSSTCSVYGASENWLDETSEAEPISLYGQTKLTGEQFLLESEFKNLRTTILRLGTVFGLSPRMRFDLVVNYLTQKAIIEKSIKILGGQQWRPFVHVRDVATAFKHFALYENWEGVAGEIFNVGSNENNYQIGKLADVFLDIFPDLEIEVIPEARDHRSYKVKFSKMLNRIGFSPNIGLKEGITEISEAIWNGRIVDPGKGFYYNYRVWD
jgi:nucleoside-diphosphate-sugar epimerase